MTWSRLVWWLALAIACGDSKPDEPARRHPDFRASYSGAVDSKLPDGRELIVSAGVELADDRRRAIESALGAALAKAMPCMEGIIGTAPTEIELDGAGNVVKARVTRELLGGTPIAECIETALRSMRIGAIAGTPIRISYPVRNMPSAEQMREAAEIVKQSL